MRQKYNVHFTATSPTSEYSITLSVMAENESMAARKSRSYLENQTSHSPKNETNLRFSKVEKTEEHQNKSGFKVLSLETNNL